MLQQIERTLWQRRAYLIVLVVWFALLSRLNLAAQQTYPGHSDRVYYYGLARNLVDGRGFQIDYIWHYWTHPGAITHPSNDFWMPLTAILIYIALALLGKSLVVAVLPSIAFGLGLSLVTFSFARVYSNSRTVPYYAGGLVLFAPALFRNSLITETPIYYAFFASLAVLFMVRGGTKPEYFVLAGASAGLAHLTRQDGLLLVFTLFLVIALSRHSFKTRIACAALSLMVYLCVLGPLLVNNYISFGQFLPSVFSKAVFFTQHEDVYVCCRELSSRTYLDWGIKNILQSKAEVVGLNTRMLLRQFGSMGLGTMLWLFGGVGFLDTLTHSDDRKKWSLLPPFLFLAVLFLSHSLATTFLSKGLSFDKSVASIIPFMVVIAVDSLDRHVSSKAVVLLLVVAVALAFFIGGLDLARGAIEWNTDLGRRMATLEETLAREIPSGTTRETVIMTRDPWEVNFTTGYRAIQIPNEDLDTIYDMALRYQANYLVLPAKRPVFDDIYRGKVQDRRFDFMADVPLTDMKVFRIN